MILQEMESTTESTEEEGQQETTTTTTVEVNFRLDPTTGRTLPTINDDDDDNANSDSNIDTETLLLLDYNTRSISTRYEIVSQQQQKLEHVNNDHSDGNPNDDIRTQQDITTTQQQQQQHLPTTTGRKNQLIDDLLLDCDLADSCFMPRTFWIDHTMQPRCNLEQIAYDILQYYCPTKFYSSSQSKVQCGAEWWVQIRPSPEGTSRYTSPTYVPDNIKKKMNETNNNSNMNNDNNNNDDDDDGISFHWDKDEELRILCDGTVYVHPHLSTVTYLTDGGDYPIPTMIIENCRINNLTGEWMTTTTTTTTATSSTSSDNSYEHDGICTNEEQHVNYTPSVENTTTMSAFISWPREGKHLCFDGRFLHAAPSNLLRQLQQQQQESRNVSSDDAHDTTTDPIKVKRRKRRYTFLVNIWMYHKPLDVHPFPSSMIDKMSGGCTQRPTERIRLVLDDNDICTNRDDKNTMIDVTTVFVQSNDTIQVLYGNNVQTNGTTIPTTSIANTTKSIWFTKTEPIEQFIWPMGDHNSNESIHVSLPLTTIQSKSHSGGNVRISWNPTLSSSNVGLFLKKDESYHIESSIVNGQGNESNLCEPDSKRTKSQQDC